MLCWLCFYSCSPGHCCPSLLPGLLLAHAQLTVYQTRRAPTAELPHSRASPSPACVAAIGSPCLGAGRFSLLNFTSLLLAVPPGCPGPSEHSPALEHVDRTHTWVSAVKLPPVSLGSLFFSLFTTSFFLDPICFYLNCLLSTR